MYQFARQLFRRAFSQGYSAYGLRVSREFEQLAAPTHPIPATRHYNLSFDYELGFNGHFWKGDIPRALSFADAGLRQAHKVLSFLLRRGTPFNIQIVGALLAPPDSLSAFPFSAEQLAAIREYPHCFSMPVEILAMCHSPLVGVGFHGLSHREFAAISVADAKQEITLGISLLRKEFDRDIRVMTFPRNSVAHREILVREGITHWRGKTQSHATEGEFGKGILLSPAVLQSGELARLLAEPGLRRAPFLHLWSHLTEFSAATLEEYVEVLEADGRSAIMLPQRDTASCKPRAAVGS